MLDNQPKLIDPAKLTGFRFNASNTSKSILGFNRILWDKTGGFYKAGEEMTDLTIDDNDSEVTSVEQGKTLPFLHLSFYQANDGFPSASGAQIPYDYRQQDAAVGGFESFDNMDTSTWKPVSAENELMSFDQQNFSLFQPFNPVMRDSDGDMIDFSGLDTSALNLDFFGGDWDMPTT